MESEIPTFWLAKAIDVYGEDEVNSLLDFIREHSIDDLHYGNIGYRKNGEPVLLDYSGFDW